MKKVIKGEEGLKFVCGVWVAWGEDIASLLHFLLLVLIPVPEVSESMFESLVKFNNSSFREVHS